MSGPEDRNVTAHRRVADLFARRDQEWVDDAEVDAAISELEAARRATGIVAVDESLRPLQRRRTPDR